MTILKKIGNGALWLIAPLGVWVLGVGYAYATETTYRCSASNPLASTFEISLQQDSAKVQRLQIGAGGEVKDGAAQVATITRQSERELGLRYAKVGSGNQLRRRSYDYFVLMDKENGAFIEKVFLTDQAAFPSPAGTRYELQHSGRCREL